MRDRDVVIARLGGLEHGPGREPSALNARQAELHRWPGRHALDRAPHCDASVLIAQLVSHVRDERWKLHANRLDYPGHRQLAPPVCCHPSIRVCVHSDEHVNPRHPERLARERILLGGSLTEILFGRTDVAEADMVAA